MSKPASGPPMSTARKRTRVGLAHKAQLAYVALAMSNMALPVPPVRQDSELESLTLTFHVSWQRAGRCAKPRHGPGSA